MAPTSDASAAAGKVVSAEGENAATSAGGGESAAGTSVVVDAQKQPEQIWRIEDLPPLPKRNYREMRSESLCGSVLVSVIIAICLAMVHAVSANSRDSTFVLTALILIYSEAGIALLCLFGLLCGDAGEVRRSESTCYPLPEEVVEKLKKGQPLEGLRNITRADSSYCVRCCVWRPSHSHHCSTCQRCVMYFDHHCGVFGRCIAGTRLFGNMKYFKLIIAMGGIGVLTALAFLLISMTSLWGGS
eukprot:TRINITY_DN73640_c0_g1_i1.p1 TRINITY_DN73640_c0_g1~~TRINITY_DN73640_c0_g1_i1.p1  ORF type:complete len:244 (-),score=41.26 TRINITY_DN73640_c0_g1_i1:12-743(-)